MNRLLAHGARLAWFEVVSKGRGPVSGKPMLIVRARGFQLRFSIGGGPLGGLALGPGGRGAGYEMRPVLPQLWNFAARGPQAFQFVGGVLDGVRRSVT